MGDSYRKLKEKYKMQVEYHNELSSFKAVVFAAFDYAELYGEPDHVYDAVRRWKQYEMGEISLEEACDTSDYDIG